MRDTDRDLDVRGETLVLDAVGDREEGREMLLVALRALVPDADGAPPLLVRLTPPAPLPLLLLLTLPVPLLPDARLLLLKELE